MKGKTVYPSYKPYSQAIEFLDMVPSSFADNITKRATWTCSWSMQMYKAAGLCT